MGHLDVLGWFAVGTRTDEGVDGGELTQAGTAV